MRATNSHGVWSKYVGTAYRSAPTFWGSIWGKVLMLLLLFGIVGAIFLYLPTSASAENVTHEMSVLKNEFYNDAANRLRTL